MLLRSSTNAESISLVSQSRIVAMRGAMRYPLTLHIPEQYTIVELGFQFGLVFRSG